MTKSSLKDYEYYRTDKGVLYKGDCLEIMPLLQKESIDLILTDPPYGINASKGVGGYGVATFKKYDDDWDKKRPSKKIFTLLLSKAKNVMIFGGNYFADILPQATHWIFWDKKGNINFKNPYSDGELIWTNFSKKITKKYTCIQQGFIKDSKEKRYHPTQKPLKLLNELIIDYTNENNLILDPFAGSGSTAIACEQTNRKWIMIEKEQKYCDIIVERLKQ